MKIPAITFILLSASPVFAQSVDQIINPTAVQKTERILSADNMRGRASFTPDIERAADYIESRFKAAGLKTWNGSKSYRQPFSLIRATLLSAEGSVDGNALSKDHIVAFTSSPDLSVNDNSGYAKYEIKAGSDMRIEARRYMREKKNTVVFVDTSFSSTFPLLSRYTRQQ
ncbi:MAG TPA: hypothetical protein VG605_14025, partial [Puia sp.]|nr:hypothetical protein [Puia sp.]